jgi:hypothetical protein
VTTELTDFEQAARATPLTEGEPTRARAYSHLAAIARPESELLAGGWTQSAEHVVYTKKSIRLLLDEVGHGIAIAEAAESALSYFGGDYAAILGPLYEAIERAGRLP